MRLLYLNYILQQINSEGKISGRGFNVLRMRTTHITIRAKRSREKTRHEYNNGTINGPKIYMEFTDNSKEQMVI